MRYLLVHAGTVVGAVDLRSAELPPAPPGVPGPPPTPGLLMGELEPTPAYEAIRPACLALVPAAPGGEGPPMAFDSSGAALARVRALGLELRRLDGAPVPTHHLHVTDLSGILPHLRPADRDDVPAPHVSAVLAVPGAPWSPGWPAPAA